VETPVLIPQLGNEIDAAQIDGWLKAVGDTVSAGEPLLTISTPKVTLEIEAPVSGTITEILVEADELAAVGTTVAVISAE
jgi:pyruvate dehydrogenase E2 component (dihydrolipoamide acetyltransferase)